MRKSLEKVYLRIDSAAREPALGCRASALVDPFESGAQIAGYARRERLDRLMDRLVELGVQSQVVERLAEYVAAGSAQEIARIRPLAFAAQFGLDPDQVVAACLHARPGRAAGAALGLALPGMPYLVSGYRHTSRNCRARSLRSLPP